jgi:transposase
MSQRQLQRFKVVSMALEGSCTVWEAAQALGVSPRQLKRMKLAVRERGAPGVVHGNSQRASPRRTDERLRARVIRLARRKYRGFNDTHMCEFLAQEDGIVLGRETLRRILRNEGIASPKKHRPPKHRSRRPRRPLEGMLLQLDGSYHDWLEGRGPWLCLLSAIDDATNTLVAARFELAEDSAGYLRLLRRIVSTRGIPLSLYTDRHGVFMVSRTNWTLQEQLAGKQEPTQVARALEQLGIGLIPAHSPQAKGRVERLFGTLQSRLVSEMRLARINTLEQTNLFLEHFLPRFNARFARAAAQPQIAFRALPKSVDLDRICSLGYRSMVANDNTVRIQGTVIDIPPGPGGRSFAKAHVHTHQFLDGSWRVYYHDRLIAQTQPQPAATLRAIKHTRASANSYSPSLALRSKPLPPGGDRFTGQLG